jgi:ribosomal-protein-alanine N-acetyltransferase
MTLRPLRRTDGDELFELEREVNAFPWSRQQFIDSLTGDDFGWAIERGGAVVGFALFSQVLDEATLLNILVRPSCRRQGLARQLLMTALPALAARGARRCLLEVRAGNGAAIALYRSLGFRPDGRRRDYYPAANGREDALLMSRPIPDQEQEIV